MVLVDRGSNHLSLLRRVWSVLLCVALVLLTSGKGAGLPLRLKVRRGLGGPVLSFVANLG